MEGLLLEFFSQYTYGLSGWRLLSNPFYI